MEPGKGKKPQGQSKVMMVQGWIGKRWVVTLQTKQSGVFTTKGMARRGALKQ